MATGTSKIATSTADTSCTGSINDVSSFCPSSGDESERIHSVITVDEFLEMGLAIHFNNPKRLEKRSRASKLESFVSYYGCSPLICASLWELLQTTKTPRAKVSKKNAKPRYFLMTLHHLRVYPTEKQAEGPWGVTRKTRRKWVKFFLKKIRRLKTEKIVFPEDWGDDIWIMSVDGTHCWINEPIHPDWSQDRKFYSHKYNKAGINYELGVSLSSSHLIWMNGPFRAGASDARVFRKRGLMEKLQALGKKTIGDRGYQGKKYEHVMSTFNCMDSYGTRKFKSRALKRQENFNNMTKRFEILQGRFRHGVKEFKYSFESICVICQLQLENGMPLYDILIEDIM